MAILFTTAIAFGLIYFVVRNGQAQAIALLGGTTALLLLCVFTIVNIALIVLRRRPPVGHDHFRTPGFLPWVGAFTCAYLAGPWARSAAQMPQYRIAAWLARHRRRALGGDLGLEPRGAPPPDHGSRIPRSWPSTRATRPPTDGRWTPRRRVAP